MIVDPSNLVARPDIRFREACLRLERVVSFSLCADPFALSDPAQELIEDDWEALVELCPNLSPRDEDDDSTDEVVLDILQKGYMGIFLEVAQAKRVAVGAKKHKAHSWGLYTTRWFYADTFDAAILKAIEWGEAEWAKPVE